MKRCVFFVGLVWVFSMVGTGSASAQFSMNSIAPDAPASSPPLSFEVRYPAVDIINAAEARVLRKELWNKQNTVDFLVSLRGWTTQHNKSWRNNNQNSVIVEMTSHYYHTYNKSRFAFKFEFEGKYGMNYNESIWFKDQDWFRLLNQAKWSIRERGFLRNWAYSVSGEFRSQFTEGFKSRTEKIPWSNFMAPGRVDVGVGLTYTDPSKDYVFTVTLNPVSGQGVFMRDSRILPESGKNNLYGIPVSWVSAPTPDDEGRKVPVFKNYKLEGGSKLNITYDRTFKMGKKKGLTLQYRTTLDSFYGWITQASRHDTAATRAIVPTADWVNTVKFKPLRFLALEFRTTTRYDRSQIDKVQMEYYLNVGLEYTFKNK